MANSLGAGRRGARPFTISRAFPFGGRIKLRLVEMLEGCAVSVVGQVWTEEYARPATVASRPADRVPLPDDGDLGGTDSIVPARRDYEVGGFSGAKGVGRVSLVDVNTKRICGEYTMPSGLK